ncbi:hypothetical protein ACEPPN_005882 [Leptodophora sp. 'Broadleaf-Isolate-01']
MPEDMTPEEFERALAMDSNNVAAKVQMHTHSHTCTKYQRKEMKGRLETQLSHDKPCPLTVNTEPALTVQQPQSHRALL